MILLTVILFAWKLPQVGRISTWSNEYANYFDLSFLFYQVFWFYQFTIYLITVVVKIPQCPLYSYTFIICQLCFNKDEGKDCKGTLVHSNMNIVSNNNIRYNNVHSQCEIYY